MTNQQVLPDQSERDYAINNHTSNLFIEAGAGTGKTETIVQRIINRIISSDEIRMGNVAAITFTDKAGAELRNRFRHSLEQIGQETSDKLVKDRVNDALLELDTALIGTIHSFCKTLLTENTIAAGLPVGFAVSSETSGARLRIARARRVAEQAWLKLDPRQLFELRAADVFAPTIQELVEELDKRFARISSLAEIEVPNDPSAPYREAVYQLLKNAIAILKEEQELRRKTGEIEFDDLLLMTSQLLVEDQSVCDTVAAKYKILLVDEFQDTDPVQWQIVESIVNNKSPEASVAGRLVLVGDPKQSIYRFRNADIRTFVKTKEMFEQNSTEASAGKLGVVKDLSANFRTVAPVLDFINHLFSDVPQSDGSLKPTTLDLGVEYKKLAVVHNPDTAKNPGPEVQLLVGENTNPTKTGQPWQVVNKPDVEMQHTAQAIRAAIEDGFLVTGRDPNNSKKRIYQRKANYGDVCVLLPVRTHQDKLLRSFEALGIPYTSNDPELIYNRPIIAGLMNTMRVLAETDNEPALLAALKSPVFGFNDNDLLGFVGAGKVSWNTDGFASGHNPEVQAALHQLAEIRSKVGKTSPVEILNEVIEQRELLETLAQDELADFETRALRMVLAHAMQWQSQGGVGLLEYVDWVNTVTEKNTRAKLPQPREESTNAVQVMTIHASKGLQFPITVVSGLAGVAKAQKDKILISRTGSIEFYLNKDDDGNPRESAGYSQLDVAENKPEEQQEANRLLYVALTRAQDHLIVSRCYTQSNSRSVKLLEALYELEAAGIDTKAHLFKGRKFDQRPQKLARPDLSNVQTELSQAVIDAREASAKQRIISPSGKSILDMPELKGAAVPDLELGDTEPHQESKLEDEVANAAAANRFTRDGRPFGRAIHGIMDLIMRHGSVPDQKTLDAFIAEMLEAESAQQDEQDVRKRISMLLEADIIKEALAAEKRWPELHLAISSSTGQVKLAEGFADLVFLANDGYVLVDYKTDKEITAQSYNHYQQQLGAYALILKELTGQMPSRIVLAHVDREQYTPLTLEPPVESSL